MERDVDSLLNKIDDRRAEIAVIGLGHVGLADAAAYAEAGFPVTGFDINSVKVRALNDGISGNADVGTAKLKALIMSGRFRAKDDVACLAGKDIYVIAVPTLLTPEKDPDVEAVKKSALTLSRILSGPALIVLTSTCYPGATEELIIPPLEKQGKRLDSDYWLSYSPARVDPGNRDWPITKIPKIVSGATEDSLEAALAFYGRVMETVIAAPSVKSAEMTKILENAYRLVNIAFISEIAQICGDIGLNVWDIIDLASTKPFGYKPFYPGPGPGGTCIPVDPFYIAWRAKTAHGRSEFIELAGTIIDNIPRMLLSRIYDLLNDSDKPVQNTKVLLLGAAYKKDTADIFGSAAPRLIELLSARGSRISYHDPHVPVLQTADGPFSSADLSAPLLEEQDAVVLLTDHSNIDYGQVIKHSRAILDTRNRLADLEAANVVPL